MDDYVTIIALSHVIKDVISLDKPPFQSSADIVGNTVY